MSSRSMRLPFVSSASCSVAIAAFALVACTVETKTSGDGADAGSANETCSGDGTWVKGLGGLECGGTYELCDGTTTLRVECKGEKGAASCQCFTNGVEGHAFEAEDTCSSAAHKGQWEVVAARFKAGCGWDDYKLTR